MMRRATLGRFFFAVSMMALGIRQLLTAEFVRLVPPLPAWVPWHPFWACLVGVVLLAAGMAIILERKALWAAAALGALILFDFLFLHLPQAAADPLVGFMWTNPAKALAMLGGVILVARSLPPEAGGPSPLARGFEKAGFLGPLFLAGFLILGGIQHFVYADFVAKLVPGWIPGPYLWVYFTGIALIAGGVGMLVPKTARLAALMSGIMMLLWVILLHIPRALADLHNIGETSGVFEALALSGAAFILAGRRDHQIGGSSSRPEVAASGARGRNSRP
jgi:uncharacterized membrane protein